MRSVINFEWEKQEIFGGYRLRPTVYPVSVPFCAGDKPLRKRSVVIWKTDNIELHHTEVRCEDATGFNYK
jgi:hypothetical protein